MFINNKKFVLSLVLLTALSSLIFSHKRKQQIQPPLITEQEVRDFSSEFNKNLPIRINPELSLIKTQIGAIHQSLYSLDFFYAYYINKTEININQLTANMIFQTCNNPTTLDLLQRDVLLRHQFITLDKEKLPYIGVSIKDCNSIKKVKP